MKHNSQKIRERFDRLLDLFSQDVLKATDEEIAAGLRADGIDPVKYGQQVRKVVNDAVAPYKQKALQESRQRYEQEVASLTRKDVSLPSTLEEKLTLLKSCLARNAFLRPALITGHYRKLSQLTESDVESLLRQLHVLGLLGEKRR